MALTDLQIRQAKAAPQPYKLADAHGLHLYVTPAGAKLWRYRYRVQGRERLLSLGAYPAVTLAAARGARAAARDTLRDGRDPVVVRKLQRAAAVSSDATTFERVARDWHALNERAWTQVHAGDVIGSLESHVFPALGPLPLRDITPPMILTVLRAIEARPAIETARRVRQRMSAVFVHAIASGIGEQDPAAIVRGALAPLVRGRQPAITDLAEARKMLARAEAIPAHPATKLALRFLALTAMRPGEIRGARWDQFEQLAGEQPLWRVPPELMKMKREHLAPLAPQAVAVLAAVRELTGHGPLPFPNARWAHRPMSENAIGYLLNRAGYHHRHVPHGWRATFSSVMNELYPPDRAIIDLMLAHTPADKTEAAYNRAPHLVRRRELAQAWANMLLADMPDAMTLVAGPRR